MSGDIHRSGLRQVMELEDEFDFDKILSSENRISITGFGSLLSERSARSTFPDLENFRIAKLVGFRRVFAHPAPIFFERGIANLETKVIDLLLFEGMEELTDIVDHAKQRHHIIGQYVVGEGLVQNTGSKDQGKSDFLKVKVKQL